MRKIGRTKLDNFSSNSSLPARILQQPLSPTNSPLFEGCPKLSPSPLSQPPSSQVPCFFSITIIIFINLTSASSSLSFLLLPSPFRLERSLSLSSLLLLLFEPSSVRSPPSSSRLNSLTHHDCFPSPSAHHFSILKLAALPSLSMHDHHQLYLPLVLPLPRRVQQLPFLLFWPVAAALVVVVLAAAVKVVSCVNQEPKPCCSARLFFSLIGSVLV